MSEKAEVSAKRCTKCGLVKPISQFNFRHRRTGRHHADCASCRAKHLQRWRRLHPERLRAYSRSQRSPRSPRWRQHLVCQITYLAVAGGFIPRKFNCEKCGIDARHASLHRHHPDYNRPLDVVWLCRRCHIEVHRKACD